MAPPYGETVTTAAAARSPHRSTRPFVSLLSDFGSREPAAGIMRAVVLAIAREAVLVDLTHDVDKFAVRDGALHLWCAVPYLPLGVHLAVVDPGVGTSRQGIAFQTSRGDYLVGPDNGLLMPAAARLGGITRVHLLESLDHRLSPLSHSFHGRDVFAPAAAHLAAGTAIEELGRALDPRTLVTLEWPVPDIRPGALRTDVVYVDSFGNLKLSALGADVETAFPGIRPGEPVTLRLRSADGDGLRPAASGSPGAAAGTREVLTTWATTFGSVPRGQLLLYPDSYGRACLAVNQGSAAEKLGVATDRELVLVRGAPARRVPEPQRPAAVRARPWPPATRRGP